MRWLLILALCGCCWGATRYVAQTAGTFSGGTACNGQTAITPATFNSTTLSAGDTTYLCGTITGTANTTILTVSQNGTNGNPITIIWDTNAILESPYFKASANGVGCGGGISICGRSYIVLNGGTNGILENTANGDSLANQQDSAGIDAYTCTNCTLENLTIQNIYVHPQNGLSSPDQTQMNCIAFSGSGWTITGNTMSNVGWCLKEAYGNGDSGTTITNNNISLMDHGWMLATSSANSFTNAFFSGNQIHDTYNWDTSGCAYHHDGIHTFGTSGSTMSGINVYNNYFYGNWGTCPTGFIFVEGGGSSTPSHMLSSAWWNNVLLVATSGAIVNTNGWFDLASGDSGTQQVYNNTAIGSGASDNTLCVGLENLSGLSYKNNTISGCGDPVDISSTTITATATNFYGAETCTNSGNCFIWNSSFTGSFSAWKTACSCDSTSIENLTALLNTNGSPQPGSPVIGAGTNLSSVATGNLASLLSDTSLGNTRTPVVRGVTWDIGAYVFGSPAVYTAYDGIDVIPLTVLPSLALSNGLNNNATIFDQSYLGHTNFNGSTFNNAANLSPVTRLTDANGSSNNCANTFSAGQGGSAEFPLSNTNTSLVSVNCGAFRYVGSFNTATGHFNNLGSSYFITTDHNVAGGGSPTVVNDFGSGSFSLSDLGKLFELGTDTNDYTISGGYSVTAFYPYTINYAVNTPLSGYGLGYYQTVTTSGGIVDFKYGLPAQFASNCASAHYNPGDYCIHPLSTAEMATGGAWTTGHVYALGDIVVAQSGAACMYRVTVASGTATSGSSPAFDTTLPCSGSGLTDAAGNTWKGTMSTAQFVVENTGTAGTSVVSGFVITGHPDALSTFVDTCSCGIVWTFIEPAYVPTTANNWVSIGGVSNDSGYVVGGYSYPTKWSVGISTYTYGSATGHLGYASALGDQGTGVDFVLYDATTNSFHHLNTLTGWWTQVTCGTGNGFTCGSETQTQIGTLNAITATGCGSGNYAYFTHNIKGSPSGTTPFGRITAQANFYGCSVSGANHYQVWNEAPASFNATNSLQNTFAGFNHSAIDDTIIVAYNGSAAPGGGNSGWFTTIYQNGSAASQPGVSTYLAPGVNLPTCNAVTGVCTGTTPFGCYTSASNPECDLGNTNDSHLSCVGGCDHGSFHAAGTTYNVATLGPQFNAWQAQETAYPTVVVYTPPASAPATSAGPVYQFTHTGCTGTTLSFNVQFCISQWSQDGNWLFWGSDWGCGLGSTTGSAPTVWTSGTYVGKIIVPYVATPPQSTTLFSLCGYPWMAGYSYAAGALINPIENPNGSSGVDDVYQAVAVTGASGPQSSLASNQPKCGTVSCWTLTNPPTATTGGDYVCDNTSGTGDTVSVWPTLPTCTTGIIWEDMGPQNQRSDVFAVYLPGGGFVGNPVAPAPQMLAAIAH
jgi:hypothetical protein